MNCTSKNKIKTAATVSYQIRLEIFRLIRRELLKDKNFNSKSSLLHIKASCTLEFNEFESLEINYDKRSVSSKALQTNVRIDVSID